MPAAGKTMWVPALIAASLCSGCAGLMFDSARPAEMTNPVPRKAETFFGSEETERWACSPPTTGAPATREDFLAHWGEPQRRSVDGDQEIWRYGETGRWCGVWLFAVLPIPFMLPICETFDQIEFANGVAVRSVSRRFTRTSFGVAIVPPYVFLARAGDVTEDRPMVPVRNEPTPCAWPPPASGGKG